ncbi:hypothetical protein [Coleofasciculus sp. FACHB-1120]|uniref:hypothetical protein n=1 Tax=Coleofasciculus sp. FACHB-1120 TaxID=2692783 RepID=UPI001686706F|nr:hypothetical protein [Coleofasciculus sp. FACHB-1120]MBD2742038.1 hypothetical protein [Coleofasciculus sp. FACHB-1120]
MFIPSFRNDSITFPLELALCRSKLERDPSRRYVAEQHALISYDISTNSKSYDLGAQGASLMPLRERDVTALSELFERDDSEEIEADINQNLLWLWPEPCWDDEDPFGFLQDYLHK